MENKALNLLKNVDWDLFYKQKLYLLKEINRLPSHKTETKEHLTGILNLLDAIGDTAEENGLFVYPETDENGRYSDAELNMICDKVTAEEFLKLPAAEDTVAVRIGDGRIYFLADIEAWECCPDDEENFPEPYRVEEYGSLFSPNDWGMDISFLSDALKNGIFSNIWDALSWLRGRNCGGIYFYGENNRKGLSIREILVQVALYAGCAHSDCSYDVFDYFSVTHKDFEENLKNNRYEDGLYIFRFIG